MRPAVEEPAQAVLVFVDGEDLMLDAVRTGIDPFICGDEFTCRQVLPFDRPLDVIGGVSMPIGFIDLGHL